MDLKELLGESYRDGMTLDDVTNALKDVQMPADQSAEIERLKNSLSNSNSEAADWKRKFRETQDEATRKADEDAEKTKSLMERLEVLEREKAIAGYKASYLGLGYDAKDAQTIAEAIAEGKFEKVLDVQKRHQEALVEKTKREILKNTHRPGGGDQEEDDDARKDNIRLAKELGKASAGGSKQASDVLKYYSR